MFRYLFWGLSAPFRHLEHHTITGGMVQDDSMEMSKKLRRSGMNCSENLTNDPNFNPNSRGKDRAFLCFV